MIIQELIGTLVEASSGIVHVCIGKNPASVAPDDGVAGETLQIGKKSPSRDTTQKLGVLSVRGSDRNLKAGYVEKVAAKSGGRISIPESEEELMALADELAAVKVQAMFRGRESRKFVSQRISGVMSSRDGGDGGATSWTRTKIGPPGEVEG